MKNDFMIFKEFVKNGYKNSSFEQIIENLLNLTHINTDEINKLKSEYSKEMHQKKQ